MEDFDTERRNFRTKTPISSEIIAQIDAHYSGGLTNWKMRYRPLVIRQRKSIEFLHIAATQLFETARSGRGDALNILDEVIACTSSNQCHQILCPACRDKTQTHAAAKAITAFADYSDEDLKFMTLLIRVVQVADDLPVIISKFRTGFSTKLRHNSKALSTPALPFKMIGAFEIDLKNMGTQADASFATQNLIKQLGYKPKPPKSQYLLHLHAIVGPLNHERQDLLCNLVERSLGTRLLSHQLDFRWHTTKPKDDNLRHLASYMFKARLQFADNIFDNNHMQKRARYHTPFKGKALVDYLKIVNKMQNFKGLKFDYGVSDSECITGFQQPLAQNQ
jgi:hypothetical protein